MENLAIAAAMQANAIRQARRDVNNMAYNPTLLNSVVKFWQPKLQKNGANIVNRAKALGLHSNKFRPNTPEYYSMIVNLARAAKRSPHR